MTWITLVRREIDCTIDVDRQIGVYLNDAMKIALVPIVTAPRLIGHVLDDETLFRWKCEMRQCPGAAFLNRRLKHRIEFFFRNDKRFSPGLVSLPKRTFAGN